MKQNHLPLWAGLSAFFSTVMAIGAINILDPADEIRFAGGILVGLITGATVYSRQKMDDERTRRAQAGAINVSQIGDKKIFSLELKGDPEDLENKDTVTFKVNRIEKGP